MGGSLCAQLLMTHLGRNQCLVSSEMVRSCDCPRCKDSSMHKEHQEGIHLDAQPKGEIRLLTLVPSLPTETNNMSISSYDILALQSLKFRHISDALQHSGALCMANMPDSSPASTPTHQLAHARLSARTHAHADAHRHTHIHIHIHTHFRSWCVQHVRVANPRSY